MSLPEATIEITVTNHCNCRCEYCFENFSKIEKSNEDEENRQLRLLQNFCKNFRSSNRFSSLNINLWGGEPIMNLDFLSRIFEKTIPYKFVNYLLYSNGTLERKWDELISKPWFKDLKGRLNARLSYDGNPIHNLRRHNDGSTVLNLWRRKLNKFGINSFFMGTIMLKDIKYLRQIWESYHALYLENNNIYYQPNLDTMNDDPSFLEDLKTQLRQISFLEYNFYLKHQRFLSSWFSDFPAKNICSLDNLIALHTDGNIYNCHGGPYTAFKDNIKLGNTKDVNSLDPFLKNYNLKYLSKECEMCSSSGCIVCHLAQLDNPQSPEQLLEQWETCRSKNKNRCQYYKTIGQAASKTKQALVDKNPKILDSLFQQ